MSKEERIKEMHPDLTDDQIEDIVAWMFTSGETIEDAIKSITERSVV